MRLASAVFALAAVAPGLAGLAYAQQKPETDPQKIELTFSLSGKDMYNSWCASCHGVQGKGDGPAAKALKAMPADLSTLAKRNGGTFPVDRVRKSIEGSENDTAAHGSREMPVWGSVFRRIDSNPATLQYRVVTLAAYVQSLQAK